MDYEFTLNLKVLDTFLSPSQYTNKQKENKTKEKAKKEKRNIVRRRNKKPLIENNVDRIELCSAYKINEKKKNLHRS